MLCLHVFSQTWPPRWGGLLGPTACLPHNLLFLCLHFFPHFLCSLFFAIEWLLDSIATGPSIALSLETLSSIEYNVLCRCFFFCIFWLLPSVGKIKGSHEELSPLSFYRKNHHPRFQIETANHTQKLRHLKNHHPKPIWDDNSLNNPNKIYHACFLEFFG